LISTRFISRVGGGEYVNNIYFNIQLPSPHTVREGINNFDMKIKDKLKTALKKIVPATKITYTAPPAPRKKVLIEVKKTPQKQGYKIPKTPKVSGKGWGY